MGKYNDNDITVAIVAVAAVAMTTSPLGHGTAASSLHAGLIAAINQSIASAFNQVMQNQMILQSQIAAMSMAQPPLTQAPAKPVHCIPHSPCCFPNATAVLSAYAAAAIPPDQWIWTWTARPVPRRKWQSRWPKLWTWQLSRQTLVSSFVSSPDLRTEWSRTNGPVPRP